MPDPSHPGWRTVDAGAEALERLLGPLVATLGPDHAVVALVLHREGPAQLCAVGPHVAMDYRLIAQQLRQASEQMQARHQAGTS